MAKKVTKKTNIKNTKKTVAKKAPVKKVETKKTTIQKVKVADVKTKCENKQISKNVTSYDVSRVCLFVLGVMVLVGALLLLF